MAKFIDIHVIGKHFSGTLWAQNVRVGWTTNFERSTMVFVAQQNLQPCDLAQMTLALSQISRDSGTRR